MENETHENMINITQETDQFLKYPNVFPKFEIYNFLNPAITKIKIYEK